MDLYSIASFLNDFRVIMLLIVCIIAFSSKPFTNKRLNLLVGYLIFAILSNIVLMLTRGSGNNIFMSYVITPVHLIVYSLILIPKNPGKKLTFGLTGFVIAAITLMFYEAFFLEGGTNNYNSLSGALTSIILGGLALNGLIRLRYDPSIINLSSEPLFWIFIAIAIENIGTLLSTAFYRIFQLNDNDTLLKVAFVALIVDYIGTGLYCVGFLKERKKG